MILGGALALGQGNADEILEKMRGLSEKRRSAQPLDKPSAGSTFKRPKQGYAAALIEEAGLKGFAIGGAQVSEKHAGFVINTGNARFDDVIRLMGFTDYFLIVSDFIAYAKAQGIPVGPGRGSAAGSMTLSAISPAYYRLVCCAGTERFRQFAVNVWGVSPEGKSDKETALEGIDRLEAFFRELGAATTLRELGVTDSSKFAEIAEKCNSNRGGYRVLTREDIVNIFEKSL